MIPSRRATSARCWLGGVAVCLALVQASVAIVSAAACGCEARRALKAATEDCCPAGNHPPGLCPLHRDTTRRTSTRNSGSPALAVCHAGASMQLVLLAGAPPPPKPATMPMLERVAARPALTDAAAIDLDLLPHAPPPKA